MSFPYISFPGTETIALLHVEHQITIKYLVSIYYMHDSYAVPAGSFITDSYLFN